MPFWCFLNLHRDWRLIKKKKKKNTNKPTQIPFLIGVAVSKQGVARRAKAAANRADCIPLPYSLELDLICIILHPGINIIMLRSANGHP